MFRTKKHYTSLKVSLNYANYVLVSKMYKHHDVIKLTCRIIIFAHQHTTFLFRYANVKTISQSSAIGNVRVNGKERCDAPMTTRENLWIFKFWSFHWLVDPRFLTGLDPKFYAQITAALVALCSGFKSCADHCCSVFSCQSSVEIPTLLHYYLYRAPTSKCIVSPTVVRVLSEHNNLKVSPHAFLLLLYAFRQFIFKSLFFRLVIYTLLFLAHVSTKIPNIIL